MSKLDATVDRDLASVDEALAAQAVTDPARRELQELVLALDVETEAAPDPAFATTLRERMEAGFPPAPVSARGRARALLSGMRRSSSTRMRGTDAERTRLAGAWRARASRDLLMGGGLVAALLIAVVVAISLTGGGTSSDDGGAGGERGALESPSAGGDAAAELAAPEADMGAEPAPADDSARSIAPVPPEPPAGGGFNPGREQRIARSAALTLEAPGEELDALAERVTAVTDRYRGYVLSSSVTAGDENEAGGTLDLRIPAANLRDAIGTLSKLATVRSSTQAGEDVTGRFVSARDRLDAARVERVGLLRRLAQADTDAEAEAIRGRLDLVARELNGLQGQLRQLRLRTNYAAVEVVLTPPDDDGAPAPSSTEDAVDDALGSLVGALNVGLRVLGVVLPLGLVALFAWAIARTLQRRRRDSALA
jgi:Domain of unknown function (DUF4349)